MATKADKSRPSEQTEMPEAQTDVSALVKELLEAGEVYDGPEGSVFLSTVNKELEESGKPRITAMQLDMAYQSVSGTAPKVETGSGEGGDADAGDAPKKRGGRRKKQDAAPGAKVDSDGIPYAEPRVSLPTILYHAELEAVQATTAAQYQELRAANYRDLQEFPFELRKQIHTREAARPRRG